MLRRALLIAAIACMLSVPAAAEDPSEADAKATPTSVHQVIPTGFWSHGQDEGVYRIVVTAAGFEHVIYNLFIQWIAVDADKQEVKLVRTVAVPEINGSYAVIHKVEPRLNRKGLLTFSVTFQGRGDIKRKRFITATPDGRYTIR